MLQTFRVRDLVKMAKRRDRIERERAEDALRPSAEDRVEAVEQENDRLRSGVRRKRRS